MRGLVYIFIALFSLAISATVYFGLTFTPIQALLAGLIGFAFALLMLQRKYQQRDTERLERSIQDLSRLLSTDAKAGQTLSRRLNELADLEPAQRLETLEADVSVLGTVVRQLAESMAELEELRSKGALSIQDEQSEVLDPVNVEASKPVEPVIPKEMLRQALSEDRVIHHIEPIITLPQRRTHGYDLVPRLMLEDGELALAEDFMPIDGGTSLIAEIEALALMDAITFARRALTAGDPVTIYAPISLATIKTEREADRVISMLDANRAVGKYLCFLIPEVQWTGLNSKQRKTAKAIVDKGVGFSLANCRSLRLNFMELFELGVRSVRADTARFIDQPASYTDFHTADIAAYVNRFEVDLIMTSVQSEQHILTLVDDGIGLAQGPHLAVPGPIRADFLNARKDQDKPKLA